MCIANYGKNHHTAMKRHLPYVTCLLTQMNAPRLNLSHTDWHSIYLPQRNERLG